MPESPTWEIKSVLITGAYGMIGSAVTNLIHKKYPNIHSLVVVDKIGYCSREENINKSTSRDSKYHKYHIDIADIDKMVEIMNKHHVNVVIHLAAQTHVDRSFDDPLAFTIDNVVGTHKLLIAAVRYGKLDRFIHMSTDEVYGTGSHNEKVAAKEDAPLDPTSPYSASKAQAEMMVTAYGHSYKLPTVIIRGNNVYGLGQYPDKLISKFIMHLLCGMKLPIHGDGSALRSFIHVKDMANAILTIMESGKIGEKYNVASKNEYSVIEIAAILCQLFDVTISDKIVYIRDRVYNDKRYYIDAEKLSNLGWKEEINFIDGLNDTIEWYSERREEFIKYL